MSYNFQAIGVQRQRKVKKSSNEKYSAYVPHPQSTPVYSQQVSVSPQLPFSQQMPQQPIQYNQQNVAQQAVPQQTTQQLIERLKSLESHNQELKSELALHNKKLEVLEKQMMVFFSKLDRYEQTRLPGSSGEYVPSQPATFEPQPDTTGTNKWQFQSI